MIKPYLKTMIQITFGVALGQLIGALIMNKEQITVQYIAKGITTLTVISLGAAVCVVIFCVLKYIVTKLKRKLYE